MTMYVYGDTSKGGHKITYKCVYSAGYRRELFIVCLDC